MVDYTPKPSFSSRSEMLEHRRQSYKIGLRRSMPNLDVVPPTPSAMLLPVDRHAKWDPRLNNPEK